MTLGAVKDVEFGVFRQCLLELADFLEFVSPSRPMIETYLGGGLENGIDE